MKSIKALLRRRPTDRHKKGVSTAPSSAKPIVPTNTPQGKGSNGVPPGGGRKCGFEDAIRNGWFNRATGELAIGFPIGPDDTVVDVGCGDGGAVAFAADRGAEVIAADIQASRVEAIERKLEQSNARSYQAIVTDADPLPLTSQCASRVISMEVLEHVADPRRFMSELVRIGKPGAYYLLTVPDESSEHLQQGLALPSYWQHPNHIRVFSRDDFAQLVEQSGLTIESRSYRSFYWAMWWVLYWAGEQVYGEPEGPVLQSWTELWRRLLQAPNGDAVRAKLDHFMPKSQVIVARKAA